MACIGHARVTHVLQVYHPCVLQTKKRYVGMMYESPNQAVGAFDAKGIETVRRDTCPAVAKMLERCLRVLFATRDVSQACSGRLWTGLHTCASCFLSTGLLV